MGLGNGTFDTTALNDGNGYFTGTNPEGITVADLSGNGRPDLIVANKGSNDVSILLNEPGPNGDPTFVPGPLLSAGVGPVATAVYAPGRADACPIWSSPTAERTRYAAARDRQRLLQ